MALPSLFFRSPLSFLHRPTLAGPRPSKKPRGALWAGPCPSKKPRGALWGGWWVVLLGVVIVWGGCAPPKQTARVRKERFEVWQGEAWRPFWIKGVNLSMALPGHHPGEFAATVQLYRRWIQQIGELKANTIRIYTLQPPAFYRELLRYNEAHPNQPLWLLQGVWLEEPENGDYLSDAKSTSEFRAEIERVIKAVHGQAQVGPRQGKAYGVYRADVSPWTLAFLLGREMDPYLVLQSNKKNPTVRSFEGTYFQISEATPVEVWAVKMLEHAAAFEQGAFGVQRPLGISNWATLDPLSHPTEPSTSSEDRVSLDLGGVRLTPENRGGYFISYHLYPYYPNFVALDARYRHHRDHLGPNPYEAYLQDLRQHYKGYPLVAAEFGLPASMASVHTAPGGINHGMQDEEKQAQGVLRLLKNIERAGLAGGIVFAWMDEWFKRTWTLDPLQERERIPFWHNRLSPEEHFGLLAMEAYHPQGTVTLGRPETWRASPLLTREGARPPRSFHNRYDPLRSLRALRVQADPAFLYLRLDVQDLDPAGIGRVAWDEVRYLIGIDTYRRDLGESRLTPQLPLQLQSRVEFLLLLGGSSDQAELRVAAPYDLYGIWHKLREPWQKYRSIATNKGIFHPLRWIMELQLEDPLRPGVILQGRQDFPLGQLQQGHGIPQKKGYNPLAHYYVNLSSSTITFRLPWTLLHLTDPSRRQIFHDDPATPAYDSLQTKGFRFVVVALKPQSAGKKELLADVLPGGPAPTGQTTTVPPSPLFQWKTWDSPPYRERFRPLYFSLQKTFAQMP